MSIIIGQSVNKFDCVLLAVNEVRREAEGANDTVRACHQSQAERRRGHRAASVGRSGSATGQAGKRHRMHFVYFVYYVTGPRTRFSE